MKRHLTTAPVTLTTRGFSGSRRATSRGRPAPEKPRARATSRKPGLALATSVSSRRHTLVLTGELHQRSAPVLEAEIERLYEEGVTAITLDLRELTYTDPIGVAVIAFRCGLCKRRGYDLTVIPGSPLIQRAFEQAGVTDLLPSR